MSRGKMDLAQHQHKKYELCEKDLEIKVKKRRERCMRQGNFSYLAIYIIYIIYYYNLSHVFVNLMNLSLSITLTVAFKIL